MIAGAESGKNDTLAHRVAHLIVYGADPRRILMLTFSRRAAAEMTRRVERIARQVIGDTAGPMMDALTRTGVFMASPRIFSATTAIRSAEPCIHHPRP